jgi:hypothetical protein
VWNINVDGFQSIVEFDPPLVTLEPAVYGVKPDGKTDYNNLIKAAVKGTDRVCQAQIDQLKDYKPATKTHLSSHLLVRARIKDDLAPLKDADPNAVFFEDLSADYQYRCIISRVAMAEYNYRLTMQISYNSHAKEEMNRRSPAAEGRMTAYYSIWTALSKIQPNPPYGAKYYGTTTSYTGANGTSVTTYGGKYGGFAQASKPASVSTADVVEGNLVPVTGLYGWGDAEERAFWENINDDDWVEEQPDIDVDTPEDDGIDLAPGNATFETMRLQLVELLKEVALLDSVPSIDAAVEALIESFGTCDVFSIKERDVFDIIYADSGK